MDALFTHCIFCANELPPPDKRGKGEHVVPELIYGTFLIKDVCPRCNSILGTEVDHQILSEPRLVRAAQTLDLKDLFEKILERSETILTDVNTGETFPAKYKAGVIRVIPQCTDQNRWIVPESEISKILGGSLRKQIPDGVEREDVDERFEQLVKDYENVDVGGSVSDDSLPIDSLLKSQAAVLHKIPTRKDAGHRLAAKIAYEMAHYLLPQDRLHSLETDLLSLAEFAINDKGDGKQRVIFPTHGTYPVEPEYMHRILVRFAQHHTQIDVLLFASVSYRAILGGDLQGPVFDDGDQIDATGIQTTFVPGEAKRKYAFRWVVGAEEPIVYSVKNL